jgi:hypothetical protein
MRDLRADYVRELSETRLFNRELLMAQTDAIMRLVDRFEDPDGRPPV